MTKQELIEELQVISEGFRKVGDTEAAEALQEAIAVIQEGVE